MNLQDSFMHAFRQIADEGELSNYLCLPRNRYVAVIHIYASNHFQMLKLLECKKCSPFG